MLGYGFLLLLLSRPPEKQPSTLLYLLCGTTTAWLRDSRFTPTSASAAVPTLSWSFAPWLQRNYKLLGFKLVHPPLGIPQISCSSGFWQTFPFCCFSEAVLWNSVFGFQLLITVGCPRLPAQVIRSWHNSWWGGRAQSNPSQIPAGTLKASWAQLIY